MANEAIPFYEDGTRITANAASAVTGKRLVKVSGDIQGTGSPGLTTSTLGGNIQVAPCNASATQTALGVASHDAALNSKVTVLLPGAGVLPVVADGAISAGGLVEVGTAGKVKASAGTNKVVGKVLADAADGEDAMVLLFQSN